MKFTHKLPIYKKSINFTGKANLSLSLITKHYGIKTHGRMDLLL
jgi:hypothetical protein